MKHTLRHILVGFSMVTLAFSANAQMQYNSQGGAVTGKMVTGPNSDGSYTITLEAYAEGSSDITEKASDIILVLDTSNSMVEPYIPTESKTWTISDIENYGKDLYYREYDNYYEWYNYYRLSIEGNGSNRYIYGTKVATSGRGVNLGSSYTGVLYHDVKLDAMKTAVQAFLKVVNDKDKFETDGVTPRSRRLGNRIAIVTYGEYANNLNNGWTTLGNSSGSVTSDTGYNTLYNAVGNIGTSGSTRVDRGMSNASTLMNSAISTSFKTVVMFTDGIPGDGSWSSYTVANSAINTSNSIKGSDGKKATVWTVGIFEDMSASDKANTDTYMSRVSSNYLGVQNMTSTANPVSDKYYIEVTAGDNLSNIFKDIASEATDHETIDASSRVQDVVSSSFSLPEGAASDFEKLGLTIKTYKRKKDNTGWEDNPDQTFYLDGVDKQAADASPRIVPSVVSVTSQDDHEEHDALVVNGFNYSRDDTTPGALDGNWVGPRTSGTVTRYAGRKLVIEFKIVVVEGATGGVGTNTNTSDSGLYVLKNGKYEPINQYKIPHTTVPVNIKITKSGLKHGESATFEIERCRPKNWVETASLEANIAAMEYNDLGKPIPSKSDDETWDNWSKVIITNKGDDSDPVSKMLVALDPYYIYKVAEDTWSWAYDAIGHSGQSSENTATVAVNPFNFNNKARSGVPKHAEAVTINHFNFTISGGEFDGKQEEHYKSSKTFNTNTTE